jgi:hypothetical protein
MAFRAARREGKIRCATRLALCDGTFLVGAALAARVARSALGDMGARVSRLNPRYRLFDIRIDMSLSRQHSWVRDGSRVAGEVPDVCAKLLICV